MRTVLKETNPALPSGAQTTPKHLLSQRDPLLSGEEMLEWLLSVSGRKTAADGRAEGEKVQSVSGWPPHGVFQLLVLTG